MQQTYFWLQPFHLTKYSTVPCKQEKMTQLKWNYGKTMEYLGAGVGTIRRKMICDLRSESFSQLWSVIRNPDHFFSYDPRLVIQTIFSMIRSTSDQIISLVMMIILQIEDHFCASQIIFADHGSFCRLWIVWCSRKRSAKCSDNKMPLIWFISYDL